LEEIKEIESRHGTVVKPFLEEGSTSLPLIAGFGALLRKKDEEQEGKRS
jgi:hypothetical protein